MNQDQLDKLIKEFQARRNAVQPNALLLHYPAPEIEGTEGPGEAPAGDPVQQFITRAAAARNRPKTGHL